jgi:hypothetical protein
MVALCALFAVTFVAGLGWDWVPIWASGTAGTSAGHTIMQNDGNLVVYNGGGSAVFHTWTFGNPGAFLVVQVDGNMVIYSAGGPALWDSGTCCY